MTTAAASPLLTIADAQRDVRRTFLGGFAGQLVAGLIWLFSAALGTWASTRSAILCLVVGGMFIFPLTQLLLRIMGRPTSLQKGHPLNALAMQIAFIVPLCLPLVGAATLHHRNWFYPALMIVVGAHYLPFTFLYGMRQFLVLGALLIGAGLAIGLYLPASFTAGAWVTGALLLIFAFTGRNAVA
ncbi:MAG TPA: hypothetical protein VHX60_08270 [Acidobacteriaceae bacterium]|nr:hypothetical protein [Acidobacteriaceae bacterium]